MITQLIGLKDHYGNHDVRYNDRLTDLQPSTIIKLNLSHKAQIM